MLLSRPTSESDRTERLAPSPSPPFSLTHRVSTRRVKVEVKVNSQLHPSSTGDSGMPKVPVSWIPMS